MKAKEYLATYQQPISENMINRLCRDLETEMGALAKARHVKTADGASRLLREFVQKADAIASGLHCPPFFLSWISKHRQSLYRSFREYEENAKMGKARDHQVRRVVDTLRNREGALDAARCAGPGAADVADRLLSQLFVNEFLGLFAREILLSAVEAAERKKK